MCSQLIKIPNTKNYNYTRKTARTGFFGCIALYTIYTKLQLQHSINITKIAHLLNAPASITNLLERSILLQKFYVLFYY